MPRTHRAMGSCQARGPSHVTINRDAALQRRAGERTARGSARAGSGRRKRSTIEKLVPASAQLGVRRRLPVHGGRRGRGRWRCGVSEAATDVWHLVSVWTEFGRCGRTQTRVQCGAPRGTDARCRQH